MTRHAFKRSIANASVMYPRHVMVDKVGWTTLREPPRHIFQISRVHLNLPTKTLKVDLAGNRTHSHAYARPVLCRVRRKISSTRVPDFSSNRDPVVEWDPVAVWGPSGMKKLPGS